MLEKTMKINLYNMAYCWAYKYQQDNYKDIIKEGVTFDSRIDTDLLINYMFNTLGHQFVYADTIEEFLSRNQVFFAMHATEITELLNTLEYEYEPLENFRRSEELEHKANDTSDVNEKTDTHTTESITGENSVEGTNEGTNSSTDTLDKSGTISDKSNNSGSDVLDRTGTVKDDGTKNDTTSDILIKSESNNGNIDKTLNSTVEHTVSPYDVSTYQPSTKDATSQTENTTTTETNSGEDERTITVNGTTGNTQTLNTKDSRAITGESTNTQTLNTKDSRSVSGNDKVTISKTETDKNDRTRDDGVTRTYGKEGTFNSNDNNMIRGLNGLFTTQNLIEQQRNVVQFNIITWITNKYQDEVMFNVFDSRNEVRF